MRIKEVEAAVGITRKNIRYYESEGLLHPARTTGNSYREYGPEDLERLEQIKLLRKLDMPISEIRSVLTGEQSLAQAARRQRMMLEGRVHSLTRAQELCAMLSREEEQPDLRSCLGRLEEMEREGVQFVNIQKKDRRRRYVGPIAACVVVVLFCIGFILLFLELNRLDPAPLIWVALIPVGIFAVLGVGTVAALISRIKEIRKGEEDDLSQY